MKVVKAFPPNIDEITAAIPGANGLDNVVFTYGDTIYNPHGGEIEDHLEIHELTHSKQQKEIGVKEWWSKYLVDTKFRLEQEVEAYRAQYWFVFKLYGRGAATALLRAISNDLASPMYGSILNHKSARKEIIKK